MKNAIILQVAMLLMASCKQDQDMLPYPDPFPYENAHLKIELVTKDAPENIDDIVFINEHIGFAITDYKGTVYRSEDGGATWTAMAMPLSTASWYDVDIEFTIGGVGIALANAHSGKQTTVYRTSDGGESWTKTSLPDIQLSALTLPDSIHCIAAGPSGVFVSADGGLTWVLSDSINEIRKVTHDNDIVFGLNYDSKLFRSNDFGATWIEQYQFADIGIYDPFSFKKTMGFMGTGDSILVSNDEGLSWNAIDLPEDFNYGLGAQIEILSTTNALFFIPIMYSDYDIVSHYCGILQTLDGGHSLQEPIRLENRPPFRQASFYDDTHGYATDGISSIFRITVK